MNARSGRRLTDHRVVPLPLRPPASETKASRTPASRHRNDLHLDCRRRLKISHAHLMYYDAILFSPKVETVTLVIYEALAGF